jgi:integrase
MAAQKLTATKVERHKPLKNDEILSDGNGLYIRFRRGQGGAVSRVWMCTYKVGTKSIYLTLGDHDSTLSDFDSILYKLPAASRLSLENARRIATEITDWRKRGLDPKEHIAAESIRVSREIEQKEAAEASARSQDSVNNLTVQDLFDSWMSDGVRRKDGNAMLKRMFEADVLPAIGNIAVRNVTEHHLRAILRAMVDRGVNRSAVMQRNSLTQMFAWARKRQPWRQLMVDGDPMELIEIEKIVSPDYDLDNYRDRVLSPDEIRELRATLDRMQAEYDNAPNKRLAAQPLEKTTQRAVWIMLSTICRVGEMSMARWEHVNLEAGEWFIPKANVKDNVADLTIYLSPFALEQFKQLHALTGHTDWCFPNRGATDHLGVKSISKQLADRQVVFKKSKDGGPRVLSKRRNDNTLVLAAGANGAWTPHDLRRTGATMMQGLGVSLDIIDRCQNHVLEGSKVRRHYLHHDYADEKRAAWHALGESIQRLMQKTQPPSQL